MVKGNISEKILGIKVWIRINRVRTVLYDERKEVPSPNQGMVSLGSNSSKEITDMEKYCVSPILH